MRVMWMAMVGLGMALAAAQTQAGELECRSTNYR